MKEKTIIYQPTSLNEVQSLLKNNQNISAIAGGTEFLLGQNELSFELPQYLISLLNVKDLHEINKTERYLDIGAMLTLGEVLNLGEKNIPPILFYSLQTIASINLRNTATIGGNLSVTKNLKTLYSIMMGLDTRVEIKTGTESFWLPYSMYVDSEFKKTRKKPHIISRFRIYSENWTHNFFKRFGKKGILDDETAYFMFLANIQKNLITDIRLCFSNKRFFRSKEFENKILGSSVPFYGAECAKILKTCKTFFTEDLFTNNIQQHIFFSLLEKCLLSLK